MASRSPAIAVNCDLCFIFPESGVFEVMTAFIKDRGKKNELYNPFFVFDKEKPEIIRTKQQNEGHYP